MSEQDPLLPERLRNTLRDKAAFTPPEAFYTDVLRKIRTTPEPKSRWAWLWAAPMKLATTTAIIMVSYFAMRDKPSSGPQKPAALYDQVSPATTARALPQPVDVDAPKMVITANPAPMAQNELGPAYKKDVRLSEEPKKVAAINKLLVQPQRKENSAAHGGLANSARAISADNSKFPWQETAEAHQAPLRHVLKSPALQSKSFAGSEEAAAMEGDSLEAMAPAAANARSNHELSAAKEGSQVASLSVTAADKNLVVLQKMTPQSWRGTDSAIDHFQEVVITTPDQWAAFWHAHTAHQAYASPPPPVDFNQSSVIGILAGACPDIVAVDILDVQNLPHEWLVLYQEIPRAPGQSLPSGAQHPYHLRVIPKTALPVHFKKTG